MNQLPTLPMRNRAPATCNDARYNAMASKGGTAWRKTTMEKALTSHLGRQDHLLASEHTVGERCKCTSLVSAGGRDKGCMTHGCITCML